MIRLGIRVQRAQAELVLAELLDLAPGGVEELELPDGTVEYAVYGPPGELPALPELRAAAGGALVEVHSTEIADDWAERWRQFHRPLVLGDRLTVRPPWEPAGETEIDVVIDPGQAFGTGAHATTRLCLELLLELTSAGASRGSFLDLGCGSGVLAISAAKLGFKPVTALDNDPAAVKATRQNARANAVGLDVRRHDLRWEATPAADMVVANLLAPLLGQWAARVPAAAVHVIASGLLVAELDPVAAGFALQGFSVRASRKRGDWAALLLER